MQDIRLVRGRTKRTLHETTFRSTKLPRKEHRQLQDVMANDKSVLSDEHGVQHISCDKPKTKTDIAERQDTPL